jgi:hypothetical protein
MIEKRRADCTGTSPVVFKFMLSTNTPLVSQCPVPLSSSADNITPHLFQAQHSIFSFQDPLLLWRFLGDEAKMGCTCGAGPALNGILTYDLGVKAFTAQLINSRKYSEGRQLDLGLLYKEKNNEVVLTAAGKPHKQHRLNAT